MKNPHRGEDRGGRREAVNLSEPNCPRDELTKVNPWTQTMSTMKPLNQLMNGSLLAVKTAIDGFQRYEKADPEVARYFHKIIDHLIGPVDDLNVWAIREQINEEDERRMRSPAVKAISFEASELLMMLSKQELNVLKLVSRGHTLDAMAELLSISKRTLLNHRTHITEKLGLGSVKELTKFAIDHFTFL